MLSKNLVEKLQPSERIAIISPDGTKLSYADLHQRVGEIAGALQKRGITSGDRILVLVPMSIELYLCLLALFWIGATVVLVDPSAPLDQILPRFQLKGFIGSGKAHLLRLKFRALRGLNLYVSTSFTPLFHRRLSSLKAKHPAIVNSDSPALLTFTTGSTGAPKAIARSHAFLLNQHYTLSHHLKCDHNTIDLPTLPVFLLHSLAGGATCVLADTDLRNVGSVDPQTMINQIQQEKISSISGSPAFFAPIVQYLKENEQTLPFVRQVFTGGARVKTSIARDMQLVFPNAQAYIVYGSTESEPISVLNLNQYYAELEEGEKTGKGALVGFPVPEIMVWIRNDEIVVTGNHVNQQYYQDPEATSTNKIKKDNKIWHRTGDAGYIDHQGRIWLLGRIGTKVQDQWPMPIEAQAETLDFVKKAAFMEWNHKPLLVLELTHQPTNWQASIEQICPHWKIVPDIPVDPRHNAKIDRKELRKMLSR